MAKTKTAKKKTTARTKSGSKASKTTKSSRSTKKTAAKRSSTKASKKASDKEVTIDRRRKPRRTKAKSETAEKPVAEKPAAAQPKLERRKKVNRRRQIDPTTCERDYSDHEVEFMNALDEYKRTSGRMFPTCSEVLEVVRSLGYLKLSAAEMAARSEDTKSEPTTDAAVSAEANLDEVNQRLEEVAQADAPTEYAV